LVSASPLNHRIGSDKVKLHLQRRVGKRHSSGIALKGHLEAAQSTHEGKILKLRPPKPDAGITWRNWRIFDVEVEIFLIFP
jgi:hypothetical protein